MKGRLIRIEDMNLRNIDVRGGHSNSISGEPVAQHKKFWAILSLIIFLVCALIGFCVQFVIQ